MRKLLLAIAAVLGMAPAAARAGTDRYLDDAIRAELGAKGTISRVFQGKEPITLIPSVGSSASFTADVEAFDATVGVEVLRAFPRPLAAGDECRGMLGLLNALASVSTMKALPYWSVTRNKEWTLIIDSYTVESPDNHAKRPDTVFTAVPAGGSFYSYQEDSTFGKNIYKTSFISGSDSLWVKTENLSSISYLFIPVIPERGFVSHTLIIAGDAEILFYGVALLRTTFPIGDRQSRAQSLTNRVVAMSNWLKERLGL